MRDDPIPPEHHVARLAKGSFVGTDGRPTGSAFRLKPGEEYLSVNWLEFFARLDRSAQLAEVRKVLAQKFGLSRTYKLGVLNLGQTIRHVALNDPNQTVLRALYRPDEPAEPADPSHAGLFGTAADDDLVADLIAESVIDVQPAK